MRLFVLTVVMLGAFVASRSAGAQSFSIQFGGGSYDHSNRDFDFWLNKRLIQEAIDAAQFPIYRFTYASYKLRAVLLDLERLPRTGDQRMVQDALELSIQKLNDYRLNRREVADLVRDCGEKAIGLLDRLERGGRFDDHRDRDLRSFLARMQEVQNLVERDRRYSVSRALDLLRSIEDDLLDLRRDQHLENALNAVRVIEDKIRDSGLGYAELVDVVRDCARVFEENLREADCFDDDHFFDGGGQDFERSPRVFLGQTRYFSKRRYEERLVNLQFSNEAFRALRVRARGDFLNIQCIEVVFENGERQQFYNLGLQQNQAAFLDIRGRRRRIQSIEVTAISSIIWGTEAYLEVEGVK